jgi:Phage protein U
MALPPIPGLPRIPDRLPSLPGQPFLSALQRLNNRRQAPVAPVTDPSPRELMTLGLFVFGMDTLPYQTLRHAIEWRHGKSERHQARAASQFLGPGAETITISGLLVPEIAGSYSAFDRIVEMAGTGEDYPLMDGLGRILGHFHIVKLDRDHLNVIGGGLPRQVGFSLDLERAADPPARDAGAFVEA